MNALIRHRRNGVPPLRRTGTFPLAGEGTPSSPAHARGRDSKERPLAGKSSRDRNQRRRHAAAFGQQHVVRTAGRTCIHDLQRQAALAQKQARQEQKKPPVKVADAPRRAVREAPEASTYRASIRPSLDPSRFASTRRPKPETTNGGGEESGDSDPESRSVGRLDDIAQLLSETAETETSSESLIQVAEEQPQEPPPAIDTPIVSRPKVEMARSKPIVSRPKVETSKPKADPKAAKLAAEKRAKAEADKKAKAEAAKVGVAGTTWVQLAGGANQDRLGSEFKKLAAKAGALLKSRSGYVTEGKDYFRLLVGPFASPGEAQAFVTKLDKAGVDSFRWTRNPAQIRIEKLKS